MMDALINNPWEILKSEEVYDSPWISVTKHDVLDPSKAKGTYSVVHFKHVAIGVLPLDDNYNTWIVGQYRFPLNKYTWEIPEGGGALTELPVDAAKRELSEEVGIAAKRWRKIQEFDISNASTDEKGVLFLAQELSFHQAHPDGNEELSVKKISFEELYQMVLAGEVTDSLSVLAVLRVKDMMNKNEI